MLVGKAGRRPPFTLGSNDLCELVRRAWQGLRGRSLDRQRGLDLVLAGPERSLVAEWLAQGTPPCADPVLPVECPRGFVTAFSLPDPPRIPEARLPAMMLRVSDALLSACGITVPARPAIPAAQQNVAGVSHREIVAGAILEQAPVGTFVDGDADAGALILSGDYVLPTADGAASLIRIAVAFTVHHGLRTKEPGEFSMRCVSLEWVGIDRPAANLRLAAVLDALKADAIVDGWTPPASAEGGVPELLFAMSRQAMTCGDEALVRAGKAAQAASAELEAAMRRAERRHADREAELVLQRDAARATIERERAKQELRGHQAEASPAESNGASLSADAERRAAEAESRCVELQAIADDRMEEVDALRQAMHAIEAERDAAMAAMATMGVTPASVSGATPAATLSEIGGWSHRALDGKVILVPRALRSVRKSNFGDPALVYRVLEALRDDYWAMKFDPSDAAKARWQHFLRRERLTCGPTGIGPESRLSETYRASWDGRRVPLDMHLQGNSCRDETRQFRLYFHNDEANRQIVVGHLPSHLPNRDT